MVKVKTFGVIRTTTGFGTLELEAKNLKEVFSEISRKMEEGYYEDIKKQEERKNDPKLKYWPERNAALQPHKELKFGDAVVYVNGDRCMRKGKKLNDGDEIWLLSPAAGG